MRRSELRNENGGNEKKRRTPAYREEEIVQRRSWRELDGRRAPDLAQLCETQDHPNEIQSHPRIAPDSRLLRPARAHVLETAGLHGAQPMVVAGTSTGISVARTPTSVGARIPFGALLPEEICCGRNRVRRYQDERGFFQASLSQPRRSRCVPIRTLLPVAQGPSHSTRHWWIVRRSHPVLHHARQL